MRAYKHHEFHALSQGFLYRFERCCPQSPLQASYPRTLHLCTRMLHWQCTSIPAGVHRVTWSGSGRKNSIPKKQGSNGYTFTLLSCARFMACLTITLVSSSSVSIRPSRPFRTSGLTYMIPFGATVNASKTDIHTSASAITSDMIFQGR